MKPFRDGNALRFALNSFHRQHVQDPTTPTQHIWVMQRMVARIANASTYNWAVKGAQALFVRLPDFPRVTRDIDAVMQAPSPDEAVAELCRCLEAPLEEEDYLRFTLASARPSKNRPDLVTVAFDVSLMTVQNGEDVPLRLTPVKIDLLVSEQLVIEPEFIHLTPHVDLGKFTQWPRVPVVSAAQHVAEKLGAMFTMHGVYASSRARDFTDLVLLCRYFPPKHEDLVRFLHETASAPRSAPTTLEFPSVFSINDESVSFYKAVTGVPPLEEAIRIVEAVVNPALAEYHAQLAAGTAPTPPVQAATTSHSGDEADDVVVRRVRRHEKFWATMGPGLIRPHDPRASSLREQHPCPPTSGQMRGDSL